jgi:lipopolysaccharide biosynthesis protein
MNIRSIAIHLPQFHPIPENDEWWGKGFTEWTNVAKAKPLFKGHYQPHLPADLGFYDLRLAEARQAQADLAKQHGIYGFCYYHYWFNGERLLEEPVKRILESEEPDFPFMLCWANENWTRRWDGGENIILKKQDYSKDDALAHIRSLIPVFKDKRYIKVDGKPVFSIYKSQLIPCIEDYVRIFREEAAKHGMELYLCQFETSTRNNQQKSYDFDASVEFQPFSSLMYQYQKEVFRDKVIKNLPLRIYLKFLQKSGLGKTRHNLLHRIYSQLSYAGYVDFLRRNYKYPSAYKRFPCVTPMWDNTARRGQESFLFKESTPEKYQEWLRFHRTNFNAYGTDENFIFINAWNEWAEGNHLEPCLKWGNSYLDATKAALQ